MQTTRATFDTDDGLEKIPSENFGVLRLRRQVFNENSYAGGMVTTRIGDDGSYNLAYGLDGVFRLFGDDYLTFGLAHTLEDSLVEANAVSPFDAGLARVRWERRTNEGLGYEVEVKSSGADYNPGMGFALRTDVTRLGSKVSYSLTPGEHSRILKHVLALEGSAFTRHQDGSIESAEVGPQYILISKSYNTLFVNPKIQFEDLREPFELSDDAEVPEGSYTFYGITTAYQPGPRLFRTGFIFDAGTFYDGWRLTAGIMPTWTLSRFLELSGEYLLNRVRFPDRDQRFNADIVRLRAKAALNTHLSANVFVQYNSFSDAVLVNLRLRYNFSEGHDLYIVYNEGLNTDRHRETPFLPLTDTRTILVKYTYTFVL